MTTYKVAVEWVVFSEVEVEAATLDEAISEVESNESLIPSEGAFVENSLVVNQELTYSLNKKHFS